MAAPVPKHSQLRPGVPVSIVLKADQRTNKLTIGKVAQVLTSGDHPHGVKVKLQDGQVGRVKQINGSAATSPKPLDDKQSGNIPLMSAAEIRDFENSVGAAFRRDAKAMDRNRRGLQDDVRNDEQPVEERSLEDYVTFKPARQGKKKGKRREVFESSASLDEKSSNLNDGMNAEASGNAAAQTMLEKEFGNLDSALIAAVLNDHGDPDGARSVLKSLSG